MDKIKKFISCNIFRNQEDFGVVEKKNKISNDFNKKFNINFLKKYVHIQ